MYLKHSGEQRKHLLFGGVGLESIVSNAESNSKQRLGGRST